MNDRDIVSRLQNGEENAFDELVARYLPYVSAVLNGIGGGRFSPEDVEDLSADVFLSVWKNRNSLKACESLKPYIAQAARNAAWSRLRRSGRDPVPFRDDILTVSAGGPDEAVEAEEEAALLNSAVAGFREPDREIFVRHYFYGEPLRSISQNLLINPATVKTKLFRCRKQLKKILKERGCTEYEKASENQ